MLLKMEEVILFLFLVHVKSQPPGFDIIKKPDKCNRPAEDLFRQCCVFPPFFVRDVAKYCGALFEVIFIDNKNNVTGLKRTANSRCDYWVCLLNKYGLVNEDNSTLSDEKYFHHLDKWVQYNPEFSTVMTNAKVHCKNIYRMFLPLKLCDFFNLQGCIRRYINADCPLTIPTKECMDMKKFYEECRDFYI